MDGRLGRDPQTAVSGFVIEDESCRTDDGDTATRAPRDVTQLPTSREIVSQHEIQGVVLCPRVASETWENGRDAVAKASVDRPGSVDRVSLTKAPGYSPVSGAEGYGPCGTSYDGSNSMTGCGYDAA